MSLTNWIIAVLTGLMGGWIVFANWGGLIRWIVTKKSYSSVPFIGGILLAICLYNTPISRFWYIGLLVDTNYTLLIFACIRFGIRRLLHKEPKQ